MPVFSLDSGRLSPARPNLNHSEDIVREALMAVRDQVVELIYQPLFPVAWLTETSRGNTGERHTSLVTLDPSGKTVTVDVVQELNASILMASLARAARHEEISRGKLSGLYPRGVAAFRKDWQEFLDACPSGLVSYPRLIVMAVEIGDDVKNALDALVGANIEVHRIELHESRTGILVSLEEVRAHEASFLAIGQAARTAEIAPESEIGSLAGAITASSARSDAASAITAHSPDEDTYHYGEPDGGVEEHLDQVNSEAHTDRAQGDSSQTENDQQGAEETHGGSAHEAGGEAQQDAGFEAGDGSDQFASADTIADPSDLPGSFFGIPHATPHGDTDESESSREQSEESADAYAEDDAEQEAEEHFQQVGFTPDGTGVASADETASWFGVSDETSEFNPESVEWPERVTELQKVAERHGSLTLTFKSLRRRVNATATLTDQGEIVLENGDSFSDPDQAASAVAEREMDGWKNWKTADGTRLGDLRS